MQALFNDGKIAERVFSFRLAATTDYHTESLITLGGYD